MLSPSWNSYICGSIALIFKQTAGLMAHSVLEQLVNSPTKSRTNNILLLVIVSTALQEVGLTTHYPGLVCKTEDC